MRPQQSLTVLQHEHHCFVLFLCLQPRHKIMALEVLRRTGESQMMHFSLEGGGLNLLAQWLKEAARDREELTKTIPPRPAATASLPGTPTPAAAAASVSAATDDDDR